jgi:hypothetical protein
MTLGATTFGLNKTEFSKKLGNIIKNFRANSKLVGEPKEFILRCCKLTERWDKLANDPETSVHVRYNEIAGGRKVKMIYLERGTTRQPVPKNQLVDSLYPVKRISTSATPEGKHYNSVKAAMRLAVTYQLRAFRDSCQLPTVCSISGRKIRPYDKTDVDHIGLSFSEIADRFIASQEIKYTDITLKGPPTAKIFTDWTLWEKWVAYHLQYARFALVFSSSNRSKGCGDYTTPVELYGSFAKETPEDLALDF